MSKDCGFECPLGQYAEATFDGSTNPGGPAIRVSSESGAFGFRGLVALYVPDQEVIALVLWDGENLSDVPEENVITSVSLALVAGDVLRIEADDEGDPTSYVVSVNGVAIISQTISEDDLPFDRPCVGFVRVANVTADLTPVEGGGEGDADLVINKTVAEDRTSTTTPTNDADFSFAIGANETWVVFMMLRFTAGNTAKYGFVGPSGCTGFIWDDEYGFKEAAVGSFISDNLGGGVPIKVSATITNGATAGTVNFQWSQSVSSATTATLGIGSHMVAFKKA